MKDPSFPDHPCLLLKLEKSPSLSSGSFTFYSYATVVKSYRSARPCKCHPLRLNNLRCDSATRVHVTTAKDAQILSLCAVLCSTNTDWPIIIDTIPLFQPLKPSTWVVPKFLIAISNTGTSPGPIMVYSFTIISEENYWNDCVLRGQRMFGIDAVPSALRYMYIIVIW